jgi:predicted ABC-type ATPase
LQETLGVVEFVNADMIAQGLAAFAPERVAIEAGSIMHARLRELAERRRSFAFETTLASRSLAPWLAELVRTGYQFHLFFLWLPSADHAVARVRDRVRLGGHGVPEEIVRRRYERGLRNFFRLYQPLASTWAMYDNADMAGMRLLAAGRGEHVLELRQQQLWNCLREEYAHGE